MRSLEQPSLDQNGFTWMKFRSALAYDDFGHDEVIRELYYPEVAAMLRQQTGVEYAEVVVLDHEVNPARIPGRDFPFEDFDELTFFGCCVPDPKARGRVSVADWREDEPRAALDDAAR